MRVNDTINRRTVQSNRKALCVYIYTRTIIQSTLCKKSTWWVTSKMVLFLRAPMIHSCNKVEKLETLILQFIDDGSQNMLIDSLVMQNLSWSMCICYT